MRNHRCSPKAWLLLVASAALLQADCPEISKWSAEGNANDSIGTNNGTLVGNVTYAPGKVGQAFSLPYGSYVSVPASSSLNNFTSFTWKAYINPTTLTNNPVVMSKQNGVFDRVGLQVTSSGQLCGYINSSNCSAISGGGVVQAGVWTYVAMSYDAGTSTLTLYANGAVVQTATPVTAPTSNGAPLTVGIDMVVPSTYFQGLIDEIEFFGCPTGSSPSSNPPGSCSTTVAVPGTSNPWLAGMPAGSTDAGHDSVPQESPAQVTGVAIKAGASYTFSATGGVFFMPSAALDGPDGNAGIGSHSGGASNGIADFTGPWNSLIAVFLDDTQPSLTPAPVQFSYLPDAATVSPGLKQVFFIGDGKTTTGATQTFIAPAGATRLFLGTLDGYGWFNNVGSFTVTVNGICGGTSQCSTSTPSGLVSYWPEDGTPNDVKGVNNPSTTNALSFVQGEINQAVSLGAGGYLPIPDNGSLDNQQFTFSTWVKPLGPGPNDDGLGSVIVAKTRTFPVAYTYVSMAIWWSSTGHFSFSIGNAFTSSDTVTSSNSYPAGQFYHLVATYDGAVVSLYVNGQLVASQMNTQGIQYETATPWTFGSADAATAAQGYPRTFNGLIDDVRIYNRALSAADVSGLFNDCSIAPTATPVPVITGGLPATGGLLGPGSPGVPGQVSTQVAGTGHAGCTVQLTISDSIHPADANNNRTISASVDPTGAWSIPLTLDDCNPVIDVVQICNGVPSAHQKRQIFVDGTPPAFGSGGPSDGITYAVSGGSAGGGPLSSILLDGSAADSSAGYCQSCAKLSYAWYQIGAGGVLTQLGGGGALGTLTGGGSQLTIGLAPGSYDFQLVVTDVAGNQLVKRCHRTVLAPMTVGTGLPGGNAIFGPADGVTFGQVTRTLSGTGTSGATINVIVSGASGSTTSSVQVDGNGNWSLPVTIKDGAWTLQIQEVYGGVPGPSIQQQIYVDGTPPVIAGMKDGSSYVVPGGAAGPIVVTAGASDLASLVPGDALGYEWDLLPAGGSGSPVVLCSGSACGDTLQVAEPAGAYDIQVVVTDKAGNKAVKKCHRIVLKRPTQTVYTGVLLLANGGPGTLSAVVTDITPPVANPAPPVVGRLVSLTLGTAPNAQSCTGTLQNDGTVQCQLYKVDQPLGPGAILQAAFAGDDTYLPSSDQKTALVFAWSGTGNFVIGDQSAVSSGSVMFWGAQWAKQNVLSGGSSPNAFKGYQDLSNPNPPACGGTWTTDPGNSSGPPSSVPAYMGVIVSSSTHQSGSTISGDIPKIVIVQTDPGYDSNPGHAGTGKVVAVLCGK